MGKPKSQNTWPWVISKGKVKESFFTFKTVNFAVHLQPSWQGSRPSPALMAEPAPPVQVLNLLTQSDPSRAEKNCPQEGKKKTTTKKQRINRCKPVLPPDNKFRRPRVVTAFPHFRGPSEFILVNTEH